MLLASRGAAVIYPNEFLKLVSHEPLPLRWGRFYALLAYTYVRPNELAALRWADVDLDFGLLDVNKAWDFTKNEQKAANPLVLRGFGGLGFSLTENDRWHPISTKQTNRPERPKRREFVRLRSRRSKRTA
jgi:integrase